MEDHLSEKEKEILLALARQALDTAVHGRPLAVLDLSTLPERLGAPGASFVTLTRKGMLRGCIGALEPYQPLAEDVREHAIAAAFNDYRFPPVTAKELDELEIEISVLTRPKRLDYDTPEELLSVLRPGIDGVTLIDGSRRATFLPQVWEKLPDKERFLQHLCQKMGAKANFWREKPIQVQTYQVEEFHE
ncbi:MAG TPA: AmmeMemoRadiSam system protein A [Anaerolineales bacterium]|nr:AmmeMemoRadiSam system protein A [Anaerolineales bacterium]